MKKPTVKYGKGEIGRVRIVEDFLPPPERLVLRENNVKVTLSLSQRSAAFFKRAARQRRVPYQRMIRALPRSRPTCCVGPMTMLLEQALRQVEQLPEAEQDAAAGALLDYVKHMSDMRLTDAQVAEVRRRRADPNRKLLSHAEALERIGRLGS